VDQYQELDSKASRKKISLFSLHGIKGIIDLTEGLPDQIDSGYLAALKRDNVAKKRR
jgi:hypothetical protein